MLAKKLTSLQHPHVLHWAQLLKSRPYRHEAGSVLVSGEKLVRELAPVKRLICLEEAPDIPAEERYIVTDSILKKITGVEAPDGFAAEIPLPPPQDIFSLKTVLILDRIADPGNLGTLLRTAYALGWDGTAMLPGTVDLFNDKAIRAAQGATFRLPYAALEPESFGSWKGAFYVADMDGAPLSELKLDSPRALILGNEGQGISPWAEKLGTKVRIPMRPGAESLNVAAAGAILLYAMRPS